MSNIGLGPLISPHSVADFLKTEWPKEPFVVHGLSATVAPLTELPCLRSLDDLLNCWPKTVQVHLPDVRDEVSSIDATPAHARKLFSNKMGLLFNQAQEISPLLTSWLEALRVDLGLPLSTVARCLVYATPDGQGTTAHFDQNINFVLQLQGTKRWSLAPNVSVENPTQRHTLHQPLDPELASYLDAEMPTSAPAATGTEMILTPGSMLFVPRGYWHSTEAEGEALALNFTFSQPTWVDLLMLALRSRLTLSPAWRELADGVHSRDEITRIRANEKFDLLLQDLVHDLPNWRAEDILAATEGEVS